MTVTDDEYGAVVAKTEPLEEGGKIFEVIKDKATFLIGKFGLYKLAIMQTKPGQHEITSVRLVILSALARAME